MEDFKTLEANPHEFDEDFDLGSGERVSVIMVEDEGEIIRKEMQSIKQKRIVVMFVNCDFVREGCKDVYVALL